MPKSSHSILLRHEKHLKRSDDIDMIDYRIDQSFSLHISIILISYMLQVYSRHPCKCRLINYTNSPQTPGYVEYRGKISRLCSGRRVCPCYQTIQLAIRRKIFTPGRPIAPSTITTTYTALCAQCYRSLKTFGFQPSFNSASRSAVSAAFLASPSMRSLALKILLCK